MTAREWRRQLAGFLASLAATLLCFSVGYLSGSVESGNFRDDVILDPSQVEIEWVTP